MAVEDVVDQQFMFEITRLKLQPISIWLIAMPVLVNISYDEAVR